MKNVRIQLQVAVDDKLREARLKLAEATILCGGNTIKYAIFFAKCAF